MAEVVNQLYLEANAQTSRIKVHKYCSTEVHGGMCAVYLRRLFSLSSAPLGQLVRFDLMSHSELPSNCVVFTVPDNVFVTPHFFTVILTGCVEYTTRSLNVSWVNGPLHALEVHMHPFVYDCELEVVLVWP